MNEIFEWLGKLYGIPGYALVCVICLVFGYLLRGTKKFPNDAIPWCVVLLGGVLSPLIAEVDTLPWRIWLIRNAGVGLACGLVAFLGHHFLIAKLEAKFGKKEQPPTPPQP